jgi:hypothetical protein
VALKVIADGLSVKTVTKEENCLFLSPSILLQDKRRYNKLKPKVVHPVLQKSRGRNILSPIPEVT